MSGSFPSPNDSPALDAANAAFDPDPSTPEPLSPSSSRYGIPSPALGIWAQGLQPASWRGVPFAVEASQIKPGRKIAIHDYPYRDVVWVEDLGKAGRGYSFVGFILGDDVYQQRDAMLAAIETGGPGNLVHPSLGTLTVSLVDCSLGERREKGRVVEIEFSFLQGLDQPQFPDSQDSTQDDVFFEADECDSFCGSDFLSDVGAAIATGEAAVAGVVATVGGFVATVVGTVQAIEMTVAAVIAFPGQVVNSILGSVGQVIGLVNDAAISAGVVLGLVGNFGRYAFGSLIAPLPANATVTTQIAALTANRAAVAAAAASTLSTAQTNPTGLPAAVQGMIATFLATVPDPADQLRLLSVIAGYSPTIPASTAPIGASVATAQTATAALIRRAACAALGRAAAAYQPSSYNDAVSQIDQLTTILDAEALVAADAGDEASYTQLTSLRTAVVADLLARGGLLPQLVTVTRSRSLSSLVLAYQLYGDATRADDLVTRANPVNALFMPASFRALAS